MKTQSLISKPIADNQRGAYLMAASTLGLFPLVELISLQADEAFFSATFSFPFPFSEEILSLVEQKMLTLSKEKKLEFSLREMVPSCAKEYFSSKNAQYMGQWIDPFQSLVRFIEIKSLILPCLDGDVCFEEENNSYLKLIDYEIDQSQVTIKGICKTSKESLKEACKAYKQAAKNTHQQIGEKLHLFSFKEGRAIWHSKGLDILDRLIQLWQKQSQSFGFTRIQTPVNADFQENHTQYFLEFQKELPFRCTEIQEIIDQEIFEKTLFSLGRYHRVVSSIFCSDKEIVNECISSLQFIQKISTILELYGEYRLILSESDAKPCLKQALDSLCFPYEMETGRESKLTLYVKDGFDRKWPGPFIKIKEISPKLYQVIFSIFPSIEGIIGCMIESRNFNSE